MFTHIINTVIHHHQNFPNKSDTFRLNYSRYYHALINQELFPAFPSKPLIKKRVLLVVKGASPEGSGVALFLLLN
jgi:hypothetical protein